MFFSVYRISYEFHILGDQHFLFMALVLSSSSSSSWLLLLLLSMILETCEPIAFCSRNNNFDECKFCNMLCSHKAILGLAILLALNMCTVFALGNSSIRSLIWNVIFQENMPKIVVPPRHQQTFMYSHFKYAGDLNQLHTFVLLREYFLSFEWKSFSRQRNLSKCDTFSPVFKLQKRYRQLSLIVIHLSWTNEATMPHVDFIICWYLCLYALWLK